MNNWKYFCHCIAHPEFERATLAEWTRACGDGVRGVLRPDGGAVRSLPCPVSRTCRREVAVLSDGTYVATCTSTPEHCEPEEYTEEDIVGYAPCWKTVSEQLAQVLGLDTSSQQWRSMPVRVGDRRLRPDYSVPAFLLGGHACRSNLDLLYAFCQQMKEACVMLLPRSGYLSADGLALLADQGVSVFLMDELLEADNEFNLRLTDAGSSAWDGYWQELAGVKSEEQAFRTPSDARWEDFRFTIQKNDQTLSVFVKTKSGATADGSLTCEHLGMAHKRGGNPTKLWHLLYHFITHQGRYHTRDKQDIERVKANIKRLNHQLRTTFNMPDNPIEYDKEEHAYVIKVITRFL